MNNFFDDLKPLSFPKLDTEIFPFAAVEVTQTPDQVWAKLELLEKLKDAAVPGAQIDMDPNEAEAAGAFSDDAISQEDALAATSDMLDVDATVVVGGGHE
jgi:hypothetical protein